MNPIIELRRVPKSFPQPLPQTKPVSHLSSSRSCSLEIQLSEFLTLLGPSGCGKTTALRMISGLDTPSEGQVFIGDKVFAKIHPDDIVVVEEKSS